MWARQVTAKEIVSNIKRAKLHKTMYNARIHVDNCWDIVISYSPFNRNSLDGLEVHVEMKYKRGDTAIAKVWLVVNGQPWEYWFRSREHIGIVREVQVYPDISQSDCSEMDVSRFAFPGNVEHKLELIYKEYVEWLEICKYYDLLGNIKCSKIFS